MKGYKGNIKQATLDNDNFRKVLYTAPHLQVVLMTLKIGEDIGIETHDDNDQFIRIESGDCKCSIDNNNYDITEGDAILVPAGAKHNVVNTGKKPLKLYTIYGPPNHLDGVIRMKKQDAENKPEKYNGITSE